MKGGCRHVKPSSLQQEFIIHLNLRGADHNDKKNRQSRRSPSDRQHDACSLHQQQRKQQWRITTAISPPRPIPAAVSRRTAATQIFTIQETNIDLPTNKFTKFMENKFNVNIDWQLNPADGAKEKRQISLASGDYPDVYMLQEYYDQFTPADVMKYGKQGVLIPLNDLIDKYAPNIKAAMEKYPDMLKA